MLAGVQLSLRCPAAGSHRCAAAGPHGHADRCPVLRYAGIYWATLDDCDVSAGTRGLAVGVISLLAYTPDIYVPVVQSGAWKPGLDKQVIRSTTGSSAHPVSWVLLRRIGFLRWHG